MADELTFTFVIPVRDRQEVLEHLYGGLKVAADDLAEPYEILFVNDGSTDETAAEIRRLAEVDPRVKAVEFSRSFGRQAALTAGHELAAGKAVITLATDEPADIASLGELVARWREGFEVVYGVRRPSDAGPRLGATLAGLLRRGVRWLCGADLADSPDLYLLDRRVVDALAAHGERGRIYRGLIHRVGFRQTAVRLGGPARRAPSFRDLWRLARASGEAVVGTTLAPLRLATVIGAVLIAGVGVYALLALLLWPFGLAPGGWAHVAAGFVLLLAGQFLILGILGAYLGRTLSEARARPLYVIRERVGFQTKAEPAAEPEAEEPEPEKDDDWVVFT